MKGKIILLFFCIVIIFSASCASRIKTVYQRAKERAEEAKKAEKAGKKEIPLSIQITDADVLALSNDIITVLGDRFQQAGFVRKLSGTIQVITAAAAGMIGISSHEETELITGLSGASAIVTPLQGIWKEGERAMAFQQGINMVMQAEKKYYASIAKNNNGVNNTSLSKEGAKLFEEVTAALGVVLKTIAGYIPTIEELETATGRIDEKLAMKVVPEMVKLPMPPPVGRTATAIINIVNDHAINATSDNQGVVVIDSSVLTKFSNKETLGAIEIEGVGTGTATVSIFNVRGGEAKVKVKVGNRTPVADAGIDQSISILNDGKTVTLNGKGSYDPDGDSLTYYWTLNPKNATLSNPASNSPTFDAKVGTYTTTLTVKDVIERIDTDTATITVIP
jgi:hypothetical protein